MNADKTVTNLSRAIALVLGCGLIVNPAYSQPAGPGAPDESRSGGTVTKPGDIRPELPEPGEAKEAPIEVETKVTVPEKKAAPYGAKIFVKQINISGNSVFSSEELKAITAPYENRIVYNSELEDVRIALTRKYIDQGFINSGAVMPDQKVSDGVVQM
ncbi:MAG: hypothetical protein OEY87_10885, partial [Gammaproteobacteria bacterium]|nr:hypothetical protein [Gammaproteobacteria bacterium]